MGLAFKANGRHTKTTAILRVLRFIDRTIIYLSKAAGAWSFELDGQLSS